jgi:hypothetical protein
LLVGHFGLERLDALEGVKVVQIEGNQIAVILDCPVDSGIEGHLVEEARIAEALGPRFFFDRSRTNIKFEPVPLLLGLFNPQS